MITLERGPSSAAPPTAGGPVPAAGKGSRSLSGSRLGTLGAELALATVTVASVTGLGRLFADASFLAPAAGAALASHLVAAAARRRGLGPVAAALASGAGLVLYLSWVVAPHTTFYGLPAAATWAMVSADLAQAWDQFSTVVAPAPVTRGFVLASAAGAWLAGWLADMFAFRARARFEAVVPSFTVFLFGALLGADRGRVGLTALYLAAVLAFVVLADAGGRWASGSWFGTRGDRGDAAVLRGAVAMGAAAVLFGVVVGPRLPGAGADGLFGLGDRSGARQPSRVTVSPLVDIRGRLVNPSGAEVLTVAASEPAYWRLTSLDRFDGSIWSSKGSYQRVRRSLPEGVATAGVERTLRQDFAIGALSAIWLPAAFRPQRVSGDVPGLRYERASASLLTDRETADGLRYVVESALPSLTEAELAAAPAGVPQDVAEANLELPADLSPSVVALAREVAGAQATPYAKARALQDWFRSEFSYSLDVPPGHGDDAMVRFLRDRVGYCEQFAGTYAAMARALGLPARVAVGFTPGSLGADGRFHVTDREAHAWPEVYIAGYGWVAFEPTPGRAQPGAEDYTGVPTGESQPQPAAPDPTAPGATVPTPGAGAQPEPSPSGAGVEEAGGSSEEEPAPSLASRLRQALAALLVALPVLLAAAVPVARQLRRRRRRAGADTPRERVLVAWDEAEEDLAVTGLPRQRWETAAEYTARVGPVGGAAVARHLRLLSADVEAAAWSMSAVPPEAAARAAHSAASIAAALRAGAGPLRRAVWAVDPRPLLPARLRRRDE